MKKFNTIIIGFGNGGRSLAVELSKRGQNVAIIEKSDKMYGGACPNVGCVPSKYLVHKAEVAELMGFVTFEAKADFYAKAIAGKRKMREMILAKLSHISDNNPNLTLITGFASFVSANEVKVDGKDFNGVVESDRIVIDTGAYPFIPPIKGIRESRHVRTSEGMLELDKLPKHLIIIGGGNIGVEFAACYRRFGSQVTVLQDLNEIFPKEDKDISDALMTHLEEAGIKFYTGTKVLSVRDEGEESAVSFEAGGETREISGDSVLVSTGRLPNTQGLNLDAAGIKTTSRGAVVTDEFLRTSNPNVWAIGDVVGGAQFTYVSYEDHKVVLSGMYGGKRTNKGRNLAYSVFLSPALARVGLTERDATKQGYNIKVMSVGVRSLPRSHVLGKYTGLLKAVVDADTKLILGAALFCEESHEMINMVKLAMDYKLPYTALGDFMYTHPVMSEALGMLFK